MTAPRRRMVLLTAVALLPVAVLAASSIVLASNQVTSVVSKQVQTTASVSSVVIGQQTDSLVALVHSYATRPSLVAGVAGGAGTKAKVDLTLASLTDAAPGISASFYADLQGTSRDTYPYFPAAIGTNFAYRDWFKGLVASGRPHVSSAIATKEADHTLAVTVTDYIRGPDGRPVGILGVNYRLQFIRTFAADIAQAQGITLMVTDQVGTSLTAGGRRGLVSLASDSRVQAARAGRSGQLDYAPVLPGGSRGPNELSAYAPIPGSGWTVIASKPKSVALAGLAQLRVTVLAITALLVLILLTGLGVIARSDHRRRTSELQLRSRDRELAAVREQERRRLTEAQQLGQMGSFEYDVATSTPSFSEQMHDLLGVRSGDLSLEVIGELIVEADRDLVLHCWDQATLSGGRHSVEFRIRRAADDMERVIRATLEGDLGTASVLESESESESESVAVRVRGTYLDITDLTAAKKAAQRANTFFDAVLAATPDFTFVSELVSGAVVYASRDPDVLNLPSDQAQALGPQATAGFIHPEDQPRLLAINSAAADLQDGQVLQLRYRVKDADGQYRWLSRRITPFRRDTSGTVIEVLGVIRDVSDVMESENRLTHAALHDSLTALPNRALLMDRLEAALARSARDAREVAVLFCDLDGFKRVNDIAGHAAGDALLLEVARRLQDAVREYDTVARVGGDEFVIVVEPWNRADVVDEVAASEPGMEEDRKLAVRVAQRVTSTLREPITVNGVDHVVSASIGITYATLAPGDRADTVTAERVLQDADTAMYLAKGRGKDRFEVFEHGLSMDLAERDRVERLLRQALSQRGSASADPGATIPAPNTPTFTAEYQPVFDSEAGTLIAFEALARLKDSDGRDVGPDKFIPIAEETGIIHSLGRAMLGLACAQLQAWRAEFPGLGSVSMAVNVSALQAQHASLTDDVYSALRAHDLAPGDLILELTETALLQVANSTISALQGLRADGVGIAIDDFGTGYASLRHLATLPVSAVKIDRSFTAELPHNQTSGRIVRAVAALAADMELVCVVEGVETVEHFEALPRGVHVQGFFLGRPQNPDAIDVLALCSRGSPQGGRRTVNVAS